MLTPEDRSTGYTNYDDIYGDIFSRYGYGLPGNKPPAIKTESHVPKGLRRGLAMIALTLPLFGCAAPQIGRAIAQETPTPITPVVVPEKTPIVVNTLLGNPTSEQATSPELTKYIKEHGGEPGGYVSLDEKNSFGTMPPTEFQIFATQDNKIHVATRQDGKTIDEMIEVAPVIDPNNPTKVKGVVLVRTDKAATDPKRFFFAAELINPIDLASLSSSIVEAQNIEYILYVDPQGRFSIQFPDMGLGSSEQQQTVVLAVSKDYHIPISPSASMSLTGNETPTVVPSATEAPKATAVPTQTPVPTEAPTKTPVPTEKLTAKQVFDELKADEQYGKYYLGDSYDTAFDNYIVLPRKVNTNDYGFTSQQIGRIKQILDDLFTWAKTNNHDEIINMIRQSNTRYILCFPTKKTSSGNYSEPDILKDAIDRQDFRGIRGIRISQSFFTSIADGFAYPNNERGDQIQVLIHEVARNLSSNEDSCKPGYTSAYYNDQANVVVEEQLSKMIQPAMSTDEAIRMQEILVWNKEHAKTSSCLR